MNQRLVVEILKERGHLFAVASNGVEALALHDQQEFDVILMDGQMPEMDGYTATGEIRRREQATGAHVRIIAVTANAMKEDRRICLDAGMDDYIAKPIDPDLLLDLLEFAAPGTRSAPSSTPVVSESKVFDRVSAMERVRGKRQFLIQLTTMFLAELPRVMRDIAGASEQGDLAALASLAHRLRGAAITVSGEALAAAAERLERAAIAGTREQLQPLFRQIEQRAHDLCLALDGFAAEGDAPKEMAAPPSLDP